MQQMTPRLRGILVAFSACIASLPGSPSAFAQDVAAARKLFSRDNLVAWCIVPFDSKKRGPEERAAMLERLGFRKFAYDWRAEHVPTFDAELEALQRHKIKLQAFWVPNAELTPDTRRILDLLKRHKLQTELWVLLEMGAKEASAEEQAKRVSTAAEKLKPIALEARAMNCVIGLYNHGGWFGEPENQIAVVEKLKAEGIANVGIVYNLHHGYEHLDRFAGLLTKLKPMLLAINLNGTNKVGPGGGEPIVPLGQGALDQSLLRAIVASGYSGPIGILGHTQDDAEERLKDNLDGLDWLLESFSGETRKPRPEPRTFKNASATMSEPNRALAAQLAAESRGKGDIDRGLEVFSSLKYGCLNCHRIGGAGGTIGPDLSNLGAATPAEKIAESLLFPAQEVKDEYRAIAIDLASGRTIQGYVVSETDAELTLRDSTTGRTIKQAKDDIEARRAIGTLMPAGLAEAMTPRERADIVRFLSALGSPEGAKAAAMVAMHAHDHAPAPFTYDRKPLRPELWPNAVEPVNRDRLYDFYSKEAEHFLKAGPMPALLPEFPGLDGAEHGHWGNQSDDLWTDARWNQSDIGNLISGIFRGGDIVTPKGVCIRLGDSGELAACFNPLKLQFDAVWSGGFIKFGSRRHGFMDGLLMDGAPLNFPAAKPPEKPFRYRGFYRNGKRVIFSYAIGNDEYLDSAWVKDGEFERSLAKASEHPLAQLIKGGPAQWPEEIVTRGGLGGGAPYAIDTIELPAKNPWHALVFCSAHDFLSDGSAIVATMQGDVWKVRGLDDRLQKVRWRRIASGLTQPLGVVVDNRDRIYVQGRDQITRLHDLNGDDEIDFYECVTNLYETSTAAHDFICGLERDAEGNFFTASGKQGVLKLSGDGKSLEALATGFRNPDGICLTPSGALTVPASEGEWTPASMICEIRKGGHYGYFGPRNGAPPDLPLVYLPRGIDNSSGAQTYVSSDRWGPLKGLLVHFSFGAGTHMLVLRDPASSRPQGAVVPLAGDFRSGVHRGRFSPSDGQLYVSGMSGWGTYTADDGCFERVRYTGARVQLPISYRVHQNGLLIGFSEPVDKAIAGNRNKQFAQAWNYRYSSSYGSPEFSTRHRGVVGHDPLTIKSATILDDARTVFFEIPELQPTNQVHLHVRVDSGDPIDLFATVHELGDPFTRVPGYHPEPKIIAAHPMLVDLSVAAKSIPNPWKDQLAGARSLSIEAAKNLTFSKPSLRVKAGETIKLTFANPDAVPHNWALVRPGALAKVGDLANRIIADPDAAAKQYIPASDDVIAYTDIVNPGERFSIWFQAPAEKGKYPYLCTFPGHWMVMNGVMLVE